MAKNTSAIFKLQGTIDELTHVDSVAYGPHVRRKRGSVKEARLNKTMEESRKLLLTCNQHAKLIFQPLKQEHHDGSFWYRLLSLFFESAKDGKSFQLQSLQDFDCNIKYKLATLLLNNYKISTKEVKKKLKVSLELGQHAIYEKVRDVLGYQVSMIAIYPDFVNKTWKKETASAPITSMESNLKPLTFELPMPAAKAPYILLLRIMGSVDKGKVIHQLNLSGLAVVKTS
jgi:hypothetical protein